MGLTMGERRALTEQVARRYRSAARKDKTVILGEFVEATGYTRKYAIHLLNSWGRTRVVRIDEQMVKLVVGRPRRPKPRARLQIKGRTHTKPGSLLKHQIPIRTFADWNEQEPGFFEIDLVGHDGGNASGELCHTLSLTDLDTGWVELHGLKNKAQRWTHAALQDARRTLPIPLKGIDTDNGSEFINHHLVGFCNEHQITFTRARPYRKNDTCYVEQKNGHVVRRAVGYLRHEARADPIDRSPAAGACRQDTAPGTAEQPMSVGAERRLGRLWRVARPQRAVSGEINARGLPSRRLLRRGGVPIPAVRSTNVDSRPALCTAAPPLLPALADHLPV